MAKIVPLKTCQVCYEDFGPRELHTCGNDPCDFRMCRNCGKQYLLKGSKSCPACRQIILHDTFKLLPATTPCCIKEASVSIYQTYGLGPAAEKCKDFASGACICITGTACLTLIPKVIGYYICSGFSKSTCLKVTLGGSRDECLGEWCAGVGIMSLATILGVSIGKCCVDDLRRI